MHERVKSATGIAVANCKSCAFLGSDGDGGEPEYAVDWPVCDKVARYQNLRSFPFKKEMPCWEPNFWESKFADEMTQDDLDRFADDPESATARFFAAVREAGGGA
jgi:hypothetical protein